MATMSSTAASRGSKVVILRYAEPDPFYDGEDPLLEIPEVGNEESSKSIQGHIHRERQQDS